jgi:hypothetical protein
MFEKNREVMELLELTPGEKLVTISDASIIGFLLDSWRIVQALGYWDRRRH